MLLSGEYVRNEYLQNSLADWAPPAVQYCRALEAEIKRRFYDYYPTPRHQQRPGAAQKCFQVPHDDMTLGAIEYICINRKYQSQGNWSLLVEIVARSQSNTIIAKEMLARFEELLQLMTDMRVANKRNALAHSRAIAQQIAQDLRKTILRRRGQEGILTWLAENVEPKK